jgi:hypothetical protein
VKKAVPKEAAPVQDTIGMSTIEIILIVVPMSEGSEQVHDEQIQLNYELAEAIEMAHDPMLENAYAEQHMFDIEEAGKVTSDFSSMLVVQDGVTLHHISPQ